MTLAPAALWAQPHVNSHIIGERMLVVVPLTGAGTWQDPKRPLLATLTAAEMRKPGGIPSFTWEPSDDGKFTIVECVAKDKSAFQSLASDPRVAKSFEKGKQKKDDMRSLDPLCPVHVRRPAAMGRRIHSG